SDPSNLPCRLLSIVKLAEQSISKIMSLLCFHSILILRQLSLSPIGSLGYQNSSTTHGIPHEMPKITLLIIQREKLCLFFEIKYMLSPKCYNTLLSSLSRFGLVDEMKRHYTEMLDDLVSPDIYTFNTLVNGYCMLGYVVEAKQYVSRLIQAGLTPDYFTYIYFFYYGFLRRCLRTVAIEMRFPTLNLYMVFIYDNCCPNVRTYTVLIDALCGSGKKSEALNLFKQMSESGIKPDVYMYTVLIQSFCSGDTLDEASGLLDHMFENGLMPNFITYNALIKGFCKKNVHKAMGLLSKMLEQNLVPDLITYNTLIAGQCSSGGITVSEKICNGLLRCYYKLQKYEEAAKEKKRAATRFSKNCFDVVIAMMKSLGKSLSTVCLNRAL
ncbi:hypothetical protein ARALYDRAFT_476899, partial [Arabidopsis lyrata subsp. lyrata]